MRCTRCLERRRTEIHAKTLNAKEVLTPMNDDNSKFPIADGTVKVSGGDQRLRTSTLIRDRPDRGWRFYLPPSRWTQSQTFHAERRIISDSTEIYRRYQKYLYITGCDVGEKYWRLLECWWGSLVVRYMDWFSQDSLYWVKSHRMDIHGPGGDWRENKRPQGQTNYGQKYGNMYDASKRKDNPKWTIGKQKLDNASKWRVIYFIVPEDEEFEEIMKNARRKLENPMPATVPCKTWLCRNSRETCRAIGGHKTKYACIVEADESMRIRLEAAPHRYHEDHIAGKGTNSLSHYNLVHKFIPMPQAMKIPNAKAAVEKMRKLEKIPAWQLTKVRNKKEVIKEARNECRKKNILRHWWISVILRIRSWNRNFRNTKVELHSEVTLWKMIQDRMQYLLNKDHQHHQRRLQK